MAAREAVGMDIPSIIMPSKTMTITRAKLAISRLGQLRFCLGWQFYSVDDLAVLREVPDLESPQATDLIKRRWERLSKNAQSLEYCQLAAGYLTGLVASRSKKECVTPEMGSENDKRVCK